MKKIISLRKDANGSRFLGMIAAFYLAEKLNVKPCFHWYDYVELGYKKHSDSSSFYFNDQKILSVGADSKEDIFDKDFLKEFHVDSFKDEEIVFADTPGAWLANIDDIRTALCKDDGKKYVEISCGEKQLRIDTNTKRITIVSNNKPYVSTYDKLFDLIAQGYVEKELAEERKDAE